MLRWKEHLAMMVVTIAFVGFFLAVGFADAKMQPRLRELSPWEDVVEAAPEPTYLRPVATIPSSPTPISTPVTVMLTEEHRLDAIDAVVVNIPTEIPREASERSGRRIWARLTYYLQSGNMRMGPWTFPGAAAVDPSCVKHGAVFRVVGDSMYRIALDTGSLVQGCHVDLWMQSDQEGRDFIAFYGDVAEIEILQEPR